MLLGGCMGDETYVSRTKGPQVKHTNAQDVIQNIPISWVGNDE